MSTIFYVYVYTIDGVPRYVGKGSGKRWEAHLKADTHLGRALRKYGPIAPTIINQIDEETALAEERRLISMYGRDDLGTGTLWNLTDGGDGASGLVMPASAKQKLRDRHSGASNPFHGKTHTEEVRRALSNQHKGNRYTAGRTLSAEHKSNISRGVSGDRNPSCKIKKSHYPWLVDLRNQGLTQKQIGLIVGIGQSQVGVILRSINAS